MSVGHSKTAQIDTLVIRELNRNRKDEERWKKKVLSGADNND